jgi:molybdenum cofactor biosynthesis protein B
MRRREDTDAMTSRQEHLQAAESIVARLALVTLSDTRTEQTDQSGRRIRELLERERHVVAGSSIIPDDPDHLEVTLREHLARPDIDAIITNGGTGVSRRDNTIPVVSRLLDTPLPGFGELFRMLSWEQVGSAAMLSRAVGGVSCGKLLFSLPGSTQAVDLAMTKLILPELRHLVRELRR